MNKVIQHLVSEIAALESKLQEEIDEKEKLLIQGAIDGYKQALNYVIARQAQRRAEILNQNEGKK